MEQDSMEGISRLVSQIIPQDEWDNFNSFMDRMRAEHERDILVKNKLASCCVFHHMTDLFSSKGWGIVASIEKRNRDCGALVIDSTRAAFVVIAFLWDRAGYVVPSTADIIVGAIIINDKKHDPSEPFRSCIGGISHLAALAFGLDEGNTLVMNTVAMYYRHKATMDVTLQQMGKENASR